VTLPADPSGTNRPRCLAYYPWDLGRVSGARSVLLGYTALLREAGLAVDCFAPVWTDPQNRRSREVHAAFDRICTASSLPELPAALVEQAARELGNRDTPAPIGYDPFAMAAAALLASLGGYDLLAVHYTRCAALRTLVPDIPSVLFTYDLDSTVAAQESAVFGTPAACTLEDEASLMTGFDLVTVIGPADLDLLRGTRPDLPLVEATCGIEAVPPRPAGGGSGRTLLWLSTDAPFHELSFQWFWAHVWPRLREAQPQARLLVAGAICTTARAFGAAGDRRVTLLGVVEDLEARYADTDVLVAPYYYGAGLKTKILEALARGLPVVTTASGISNTRLTPGRDVLVADTGPAYVRAVASLLASPGLRQTIGAAGRAYVEHWHAPGRAGAQAVAAIRALLARGPKPGRHQPEAAVGGQPQVVDSLRHLVPWVIDRCRREGVESIYLYGAGAHTEMLVPIWRAAGGPRLAGVLVSERPVRGEMMGLPVIAAGELEPAAGDGIVLSSVTFERELAEAGRARWPALPIYAVWRPLPWEPGARMPLADVIPEAVRMA